MWQNVYWTPEEEQMLEEVADEVNALRAVRAAASAASDTPPTPPDEANVRTEQATRHRAPQALDPGTGYAFGKENDSPKADRPVLAETTRGATFVGPDAHQHWHGAKGRFEAGHALEHPLADGRRIHVQQEHDAAGKATGRYHVGVVGANGRMPAKSRTSVANLRTLNTQLAAVGAPKLTAAHFTQVAGAPGRIVRTATGAAKPAATAKAPKYQTPGYIPTKTAEVVRTAEAWNRLRDVHVEAEHALKDRIAALPPGAERTAARRLLALHQQAYTLATHLELGVQGASHTWAGQAREVATYTANQHRWHALTAEIAAAQAAHAQAAAPRVAASAKPPARASATRPTGGQAASARVTDEHGQKMPFTRAEFNTAIRNPVEEHHVGQINAVYTVRIHGQDYIAKRVDERPNGVIGFNQRATIEQQQRNEAAAPAMLRALGMKELAPTETYHLVGADGQHYAVATLEHGGSLAVDHNIGDLSRHLSAETLQRGFLGEYLLGMGDRHAGNVVFDPEHGTAKLIDFGMSFHHDATLEAIRGFGGKNLRSPFAKAWEAQVERGPHAGARPTFSHPVLRSLIAKEPQVLRLAARYKLSTPETKGIRDRFAILRRLETTEPPTLARLRQYAGVDERKEPKEAA